MLLGEIVKEMREEQGMTTRGLAEASGVGIATIYRLENDNNIQWLGNLHAIAVALGSTAGQLLIRSEEDESVSA